MSEHVPVLAQEVLSVLEPRPGDTAVDCTLGRCGHACDLAAAIGPAGHLFGFDLDAGNIENARDRLAAAPDGPPFTVFHETFAAAPRRLREAGRPADILLADLGFASTQMDDPERGFSFAAEGPLDMRFDRSRGPTAADLLAALTEAELADLIERHGEDPLAGRIARKLARARREQPIDTTTRLAGLVAETYGPRARSSRLHPATRTFMALRIAVNDELGALAGLLDAIAVAAAIVSAEPADPADAAGSWLAPGARVAIISFHSLEDRLVKRAFADIDRRRHGVRLTRRPVTAGETEIQANPRARSAKLRALRLEPARRAG